MLINKIEERQFMNHLNTIRISTRNPGHDICTAYVFISDGTGGNGDLVKSAHEETSLSDWVCNASY